MSRDKVVTEVDCLPTPPPPIADKCHISHCCTGFSDVPYCGIPLHHSKGWFPTEQSEGLSAAVAAIDSVRQCHLWSKDCHSGCTTQVGVLLSDTKDFALHFVTQADSPPTLLWGNATDNLLALWSKCRIAACHLSDAKDVACNDVMARMIVGCQAPAEKVFLLQSTKQRCLFYRLWFLAYHHTFLVSYFYFTIIISKMMYSEYL